MLSILKFIFKRISFCASIFACISLQAQPGRNGTLTVSSGTVVVNKYSPVTANIASGSSTVAMMTATFLSVCPGDLVMIYQAQGVSMSTVNAASYGSINSINSAGLYEFKYVQSISGNVITTQTPFTYSYSSSGYTQIIKVPQFSTLTVNAGAKIAPRPWKDTTISSVNYRFGGLTVIHAFSIINNGSVTASGFGFRGGQITGTAGYSLGITSFVDITQDTGGEKGESIGGFQLDYDAIGGRYGRGAPANGGGGGNSTNSSGGGGANGYNGQAWTGQGVMVVNASNPLAAWALDPSYIANGNALTTSSGGGRGGYSWGVSNANALTDGPGSILWNGDNRAQVGGYGGRPVQVTVPDQRIFFGGGGGAGQTNELSTPPGATGGGIVYLVATSAITGTGTIESNGNSAGNSMGCSCDGQSGGGAGGTIIIKAANIAATQSIVAKGGKGGDQAFISQANSNESEGGGGGGGGGYIAASISAITSNVSGGDNGSIVSYGLTEFPFNGGTQGASGQTATVTTNFIPFTPLIGSVGSLCVGTIVSFTTVSAGSYSWTGPSSFTASVQNPTVIASSSSSGIYTVAMSFTNGCSGILSRTVALNSVPMPTLVVSNVTICPGSSALLNVSGGSTYTWTPSGVNTSTFFVNPSASTVYSVIGTSPSGCTATGTSTVTIPVTPSMSISATNYSVCEGGSLLVNASMSGGIGPYTYSWAGGPTTSSYAVTQPAGQYLYTVNGYDSFGCNAGNTVSLNFIVNPILAATSDTICPGTTGSLTVIGGSSYTWYPSMVSGSIFTANPSSTSVYTVIGAASGCSANATATLFMKLVPSLSFTTYAITCASLGSAILEPSGGVGPFSYTWMPTAQSGTSATGLYPGTYSINVLDAGTSCVITQTTHFAALVPLTGTVVSTPSILCHGATTATADVNLSNGSGSQTYLWTDALSTQTNPIASNLTGGTNTVTVIDALTFCEITHTFLIVQPTAFTLNISTSSPSVCLGGSISFTALNSGGTAPYSYTWSPAFTTSTYVAAESVAGTYTYILSSLDANSCSFSKSVSVKFAPNPTVSVSNASICLYGVGSLIASGASSYSWSSGFVGNPFSSSPLTNTSFTVTGNTAGCTSSAIATIFIKPSPTASFTSNAPVCEGDTLTLEALGTALQYQWTGPQSFNSTLNNDTLFNALPNRSGSYTLKITAPNSCTASITKVLVVNATPSLTVSGNTVCQGQALHLNANFLSGASYTWTGPVNNSFSQNPVINSATPNFSGIYTLTVKSAAGCTNTAFATASVIATPVPTIITSPDICIGSPLNLSGSGGSSYSWFGPNGFNSTLQNPVLTAPGISASGSYSLYAFMGTCYGVTSSIVAIHALPQPLATLSSTLCENSPLILNASSAVSYTWAGPAGFQSNLQSPTLSNVGLNASGVYTLAVTDQNGCSNFTTTTTSIFPAPVLSSHNTTVCVGGDVILTATGSGSFLWNGPTNYISTSPEVTLTTVGSAQAGIYTITLTGFNSCTSSTTVQLAALNLPLPIPVISPLKKACMNSVFELNGSGGTSYSWKSPQQLSSDKKDFSFTITSFDQAGVYTLTVKNESNCAASATTNVNIYPQPQAQLKLSANNLCAPFCTDISLDTKGDSSIKNSRYLIGQETFLEKNPVYCMPESGSYIARSIYIDTNLCTNSSSLILTAYAKPHADFLIQPPNPIAGVDEVLFYNASSGDGLGSWAWHTTADSTTYTEKNISRIFPVAGNYPVVLVVRNKWGCQDTMIKALLINDEFALYVPDAFTPNGDGLNDVFQAKGTGIKKYTLEIFTRWGESIFQSYDLDKGWDGTFSGKGCKSDIYVWKISAINFSGETKTFAGTIALLRSAVKSDED